MSIKKKLPPRVAYPVGKIYSSEFLPDGAYILGIVPGSLSKALSRATRHLDVDTKWLKEAGVIPAKDRVSVKDFWEMENQSEEKLGKVRELA